MPLSNREFNNLVLITIDCLRYDAVVSMIGKNKLPHIGQLANGGVFFKQAISVAPVTPSSVTAFLTSTYPFMYDGYVNFSPRTPFVDLLRKAGFSTISCQTNPFISKFFGFNKGFSSFVDDKEIMERHWLSNERLSQRSFTRLKRVKTILDKVKSNLLNNLTAFLKFFFSEFLNISPILYLPAEILARANLDLIGMSNQPVFAWIHYMDTHDPHKPHEPDLLAAYRFAKIENKIYRNECPSESELSYLFGWYKDSIISIDRSIGSFLSELAEMDITLDNTYFILTSDHGQQFFEHGRFGHIYDIYDELIHVPLIIAGPELSPGLFRQQVSLIDLPPTILGLFGIREMPANYMGRDLSQFIKQSNPEVPNNPAISEKGKKLKLEDGKSRIIKLDLKSRKISYRFDGWKYIYDDNASDELYNLNKDPGEQNNLIEEEKDMAKDFIRRIEKHIRMEEKTRIRQRDYMRILNLRVKLGRRL